jgi:hypothetical protein
LSKGQVVAVGAQERERPNFYAPREKQMPSNHNAPTTFGVDESRAAYFKIKDLKITEKVKNTCWELVHSVEVST